MKDKLMTTQAGRAILGDGCELAWRLEGPADAPLLLLSNSLGTSMAMWEPQMPELVQHFRVLRYDTRGHGASGVTPGAYGLDRLGRDAIELLDALGVEQALFCGLSLGGMTGQWLGIHAPERVSRLVLANTAAYMGPPSGWQARISTVLAKGMESIADAVLERWYTPDFLASADPALAATRQWLLATDPAGYAGCCAAIRDMDMRPLLRLISAPSLVIIGAQDPATPPECGEHIADALADCTSVTLDAAHLSNIERPTEFTRALLDFLN